ncbi:hypothetical protein BD410DRAFT_779143, partial [Rickenella mellea]
IASCSVSCSSEVAYGPHCFTFHQNISERGSTNVRHGGSVVHPQHQVSPILRIPCKITSEIFQRCLSEDEFPEPTVISAPILLSRVCSAWRKLAIGTPRLWSKLLLGSVGPLRCTAVRFLFFSKYHNKIYGVDS